MAKTDVYPVPPELLPQLWPSARKVVLSKIPGYDLERTHARLLAGIDQLWVAFRPNRQLSCAIITSISNRPPQRWKVYERADKSEMRSLTIHLAGGYEPLSWFDSAAERIQLYARQNNCRMLFLLARRGWHRWLYSRWYSREWAAVSLARDRPTYSQCKSLARRNTPGYFRLLVPVPPEKWNRYMYALMKTCYFKEAA